MRVLSLKTEGLRFKVLTLLPICIFFLVVLSSTSVLHFLEHKIVLLGRMA